MDITVPIMKLTTLFMDEEEEEQDLVNERMIGNEDDDEEKRKKKKEKVVTFKYEYLPDFCYKCGIIGHTEKLCPTITKREGARQFGPWLRAVIYKGSSSGEKSRGSNDNGDFWRSNIVGGGNKQGSDGPSWTKNLLTRSDKGISKKGEDREAASPFDINQGEQTRSVEGKKINV